MKLNKKMFSMQFFVALSLCLSILIASSVFLFMGYRATMGNIIQSAEASGENMAKTVNRSIKSILSPAEVAIRFLRLSGIGKVLTLEDRLTYAPIFIETLKINPIADAAYVGLATGEFYLARRYKESGDIYTANAPSGTHFLLLTSLLKADETFEWRLWFYDEHSKLLGTELSKHPHMDPRKRPWYIQSEKNEKLITTRPYVFFVTSEVGLSMTQRTADGSAVIGVDVTTSDLSHFLETLLITPGTELVLVDDMNEIVATPRQNTLKGQPIGPDGGYELASLGKPVLNMILDSTASTERLTPFKYGNQEWFGLVTTLDSFYGNGLRMIMAIPSNELLGELQNDLFKQGMIALALLSAILAGGWFFGHWLAAPLRRLTEQVAELSLFNFDAKIGVPAYIKEVDELGKVLSNLVQVVVSFRTISSTINREPNLEKMLHSVLMELLQIMRMKNGAVYLFHEHDKSLRLTVVKGAEYPDTLNVNADERNDEVLNDWLRKSFGDKNVYAILRNREHDFLGVLCLAWDEQTPDAIKAPDSPIITYIDKIAGSMAVAIETRQLITTQKAILDSLITLIADAIDTKSLYTGGHCRRVPELSIMLLEDLTKCKQAPFEHFSLTQNQTEAFRIAAWLHDCGKITTPEYVVDKATKLETIYNRLHEIRTRFEVLHRDALITCLQAKLEGDDHVVAQEKCRQEQQALQDDFAFVAKCNIGSEFMDEKDIERLKIIANRTWLRYFDNRLGLSHAELQRMEAEPEQTALPVKENLLADKPWQCISWANVAHPEVYTPGNELGIKMKVPTLMYNFGEIYNLSIQRGTLTEEERFKINDHIVQTLRMLSCLPLPKNLANVPNIASNHHETLLGTGYPRKLTAEQLGTQDRIIAVADVFEALTASDRPYKEPKTLRQSLKIMAQMVQRKHLDGDIFNRLLRSGVYLNYAHKYLADSQIDIAEGDDLSEFLTTQQDK